MLTCRVEELMDRFVDGRNDYVDPTRMVCIAMNQSELSYVPYPHRIRANSNESLNESDTNGSMDQIENRIESNRKKSNSRNE